MGSGASGPAGEVPGGELRLPVSGLRFSHLQLRALNAHVDALYEEDQKGRMSVETESAVESLVQRIVDGAGQRDPRFRCCHLIALHRGKKMRSRSLEYLVTLDCVPALDASEEGRLQGGPAGFGKVRLAGRAADQWEEFLTPAGYLCRDKVVERWVELIARCAGSRGAGAGGGGGSRVLCARAAIHALPYQYCYLERVGAPQVSQERRLAIVEGAAWVMVRAGEAEAKLMLALRASGLSGAAYTPAVPLTHPLALLHYTSAQGGYYAAAVGPPASVVCAERASTWQLWAPALEAALDAHLSDLAPAARVAGALNALIDRMRDGAYDGSLKLLSRHSAWCALRRRLERCGALAGAAARGLVSPHMAHHLLLVVDSLLGLCQHGGVAGYVFRVERGAGTRRGARGGDWAGDAACLRACLQQLHQVAGEDIPPSPAESLELALFHRWERVTREGAASCAAGAAAFSRRQLRYLWRLFAELLACKNLVSVENTSTFRANLLQATSGPEAAELVVHLLAVALDQARDQLAGQLAGRSKKWNKLKDYYDASCACLIDAARRDPELRRADLSDPLAAVRHVLLWLQRGAKDDKKYLGPVLKPFLDKLFATSNECAWLLDDFDARKCDKEYEGLKEYCAGVHAGGVEPCMGLLDAAKRLAWAKALVDFVDRFKHIEFRLVFPTGSGMAVSYPLRLASRREARAARTLTLSRRDKAEAKLTLARRCVLGAFSDALLGTYGSKTEHISRQGSEEVLTSVKNGSFWRSASKPDVIPATSAPPPAALPPRRSRRARSTSHGFPEISLTSQSDTKTLRRKYHTLRSLVYTEPVQSIKEMRQRPRSAGSTVRNKAVSRPSLLETLDFINTVKDSLCVEESGVSDSEESAWCASAESAAGRAAPLCALARGGLPARQLALADPVPALLRAGKFSVLQELCWALGAAGEGALLALHRLARAPRRRHEQPTHTSWQLLELDGIAEDTQRYRPRPPNRPPTPPPLPTLPTSPTSTSKGESTKRYSDYIPPKRLQDLEQHLEYLEKVNSHLNLTQSHTQSPPSQKLHDYTGIINPIYDIKMPKDKFSVKRSKSLGRSFSSKPLALDATRHNITLGRRAGGRTNDVLTAINTDPADKGNYFQRNTTNIVGDSYKVSRVTID